MDESLETYKRVFEQIRITEATKDELISRLISRLEVVLSEVQSTRMDYERERQFNRQGQLKEARMDNELRELKQEFQRDPFVLVLIDGDGMIFEDPWIVAGEAGGKEAANMLWQQIRSHVQRVLPEVPLHFKIVARVYANMKGLGDTCQRAGILPRSAIIEDFARGFTGSKGLFDFVDVGSGKDRADEKITEMLKLHLSNINCQHIIFGCSHDNGYARLLEDIANGDRRKITLLEGVPFERELRAFLPLYEAVRFPGMFRETKINLYNQPYGGMSLSGPTAVRPPPGFHTSHSGPVSNGTMDSISSSNGTAETPSSLAHSPLPQPPSQMDGHNPLLRTESNQRMDSSSPTTTWADKVNLAPSPQQHHAPLAAAAASQEPPTIQRNKYGQRLDPLVQKMDPNEMKRVSKIKMCNVHYLRKDCPYGDECTHDHSYKPTKAEIELLKQINRGTPCRNGTGCTELKCMYGHRCPHSVEGSKACKFGNNCRFGEEMHGLDTKVVRTTKV